MTNPEVPNKGEKPEFKNFKNMQGVEEFKQILRDHRKKRFIANLFTSALLYGCLFLTPTGREILSDPQRRRFFFVRRERIGFLEDSIISPDLYHPNSEDTSLELSSADAGRWIGYDFHRPEELGWKNKDTGKQKSEGRLGVFDLYEVTGNSPDTYTPTMLLNVFDLEHLLHVDFMPLEEVLEKGYLRETTYHQAYERVGLWEKYRQGIVLAGLADTQIYTVTPKGNSLVFLSKDGGTKVEKPKEVPVLKPALQT